VNNNDISGDDIVQALLAILDSLEYPPFDKPTLEGCILHIENDLEWFFQEIPYTVKYIPTAFHLVHYALAKDHTKHFDLQSNTANLVVMRVQPASLGRSIPPIARQHWATITMRVKGVRTIEVYRDVDFVEKDNASKFIKWLGAEKIDGEPRRIYTSCSNSGTNNITFATDYGVEIVSMLEQYSTDHVVLVSNEKPKMQTVLLRPNTDHPVAVDITGGAILQCYNTGYVHSTRIQYSELMLALAMKDEHTLFGLTRRMKRYTQLRFAITSLRGILSKLSARLVMTSFPFNMRVCMKNRILVEITEDGEIIACKPMVKVTSNTVVNDDGTLYAKVPPMKIYIKNLCLSWRPKQSGGSFEFEGATAEKHVVIVEGVGKFPHPNIRASGSDICLGEYKVPELVAGRELCSQLAKIFSDVISILTRPSSSAFNPDLFDALRRKGLLRWKESGEKEWGSLHVNH